MTKSVSSRVVENPNEEFGIVESASGPGGEGVGAKGIGGKAQGKEEGEMQFLDYVTCSLCSYPFYSKTEADRKFWMTSCGHVLCGSRDHTHVKGRCTHCKKESIEVYPVDENIHPDLKAWFGNPKINSGSVMAQLRRTYEELEEGTLAVSTFQTTELIRLVKHLRLADERKEENIKLVKAELQKMGSMKKELAETKAALTEAQRKNEELVRENNQLKSTQHRPPPPPATPFQHTYAPQPFNPLTPVVEEGEGEYGEEGYSDSGPASIQRFEFGLANDRSHRPGAFDQYSTPRTLPHSIPHNRLTLPLDRPMTAEPYTDRMRESRGSRSVPARINLEKFRMSDHPTSTSTPYVAHPYYRPGSTISRPGSARPFSLPRGGTGGNGGQGGGVFASAPVRRQTEYRPDRQMHQEDGRGSQGGQGSQEGSQDQQGGYSGSGSGTGFLEGLPVTGRSNVYAPGNPFVSSSNHQQQYGDDGNDNIENNYQGHQSQSQYARGSGQQNGVKY